MIILQLYQIKRYLDPNFYFGTAAEFIERAIPVFDLLVEVFELFAAMETKTEAPEDQALKEYYEATITLFIKRMNDPRLNNPLFVSELDKALNTLYEYKNEKAIFKDFIFFLNNINIPKSDAASRKMLERILEREKKSGNLSDAKRPISFIVSSSVGKKTKGDHKAQRETDSAGIQKLDKEKVASGTEQANKIRDEQTTPLTKYSSVNPSVMALPVDDKTEHAIEPRVRAFLSYKKAAEQGSSNAKLKLALLFAENEGVPETEYPEVTRYPGVTGLLD